LYGRNALRPNRGKFITFRLPLWWARRPLAAARAVIFSSLVDDPNSPDALPAFVEACKALPVGPNMGTWLLDLV